mgnify:CR=1 FL=1
MSLCLSLYLADILNSQEILEAEELEDYDG